MSCRPLTPETPVPEALSYGPQAARVFIAHRTACVGCGLARFCTLQDVAWTYDLPLEALLVELEHAAQNERLHAKGVRHEEPE